MTAATAGRRRSRPPAASSAPKRPGPRPVRPPAWRRLHRLPGQALDRRSGQIPRTPRKDVIYVTYTDFETKYEVLWLGEVPELVPTQTDTTIDLVRSDDGGKTWSKPVGVSPTVTQGYGGETEDGTRPELTPSAPCRARSRPLRPTAPSTSPGCDITDDEAMKGTGEINVASRPTAGKSLRGARHRLRLQRDRLPARALRSSATGAPSSRRSRSGPQGRALRDLDRPPDERRATTATSTRVIDRRGQRLDAARRGSTTTRARPSSSSRP